METKAVNTKAPFYNLHQDLVIRCKTKDKKAQFQVYKLYYKAMYNTSLRIVNNTMEAEDIMQESFLSAFENINAWSGMVSFGAWLKRIVINRSLDAARKNKTNIENFENHIGLEDTGNEDITDMEEISEILSVSNGTSGSQLSRAKSRLIKELTLKC